MTRDLQLEIFHKSIFACTLLEGYQAAPIARRGKLPIIYNSTTRKVRTLPCLNLVQRGTRFHYYSFGFEPESLINETSNISSNEKMARMAKS
ncbi:hypothetical protein RND71_023540 [Anisodus tanguticus]|uniref:Uncharacterized protein n=1 Tax=Anisodus tanguticus TaxID=243964 RepID=A0AAE1RUK7_9SOLA|nr:hypothetical protein RND71_023540 [Anisodus tanguticus]